MIDLDFRSKDINTNSKLSAIFTADNFVYACFDQDHNMLSYSSGHKAEEFNAIANSFDPSNLKIAIKTTHFGHFGDKSRIPFDKHKLTLDKMTGVDIWAAYERPFVDENFNTRHFSTLLQHEYYLNKDEIFHIHFDKDQIHFYLQNDGEVILYNHFPLNDVDDLIYYHSFITQSFDLDVEIVPLYLSGLVEVNSKIHKALQPFHRNLIFVQGANNDIKSNREDLHIYHFYDHFMNIQCA